MAGVGTVVPMGSWNEIQKGDWRSAIALAKYSASSPTPPRIDE